MNQKIQSLFCRIQMCRKRTKYVGNLTNLTILQTSWWTGLPLEYVVKLADRIGWKIFCTIRFIDFLPSLTDMALAPRP